MFPWCLFYINKVLSFIKISIHKYCFYLTSSPSCIYHRIISLGVVVNKHNELYKYCYNICVFNIGDKCFPDVCFTSKLLSFIKISIHKSCLYLRSSPSCIYHSIISLGVVVNKYNELYKYWYNIFVFNIRDKCFQMSFLHQQSFYPLLK